MRKRLLAPLLAGSSLGALVEYYWNITYVEGVNPDGLQPRRVIGVNSARKPPLER